jgi:hypothetical protein
MKIRIKGNSLRFRLTRPEVERFAESGVVEDGVNFGSVVLRYALCSTKSAEMSSTFADNCITVYLPERLVADWMQTDEVGFEHRMSLDGVQDSLYLLVEKDYTCLDKVEEDQSDHYPNPLLKNPL